tara:strand:- start:876 stop:3284 length:2409 start_codon:yes stop_codon:yes gene_type:complete
MARAPIGGLMDTNVPSQLDEDDLAAELELEIPDSQETPLMLDDDTEIEIVEEDDGGVLVDFDPSEDFEDMDFADNLAEGMDDRELGAISSELMGEFDANKASRQEWEDAYTDGLELLGFNYEERTEPFRGASGVTHPLLAEAATQFQAQAFNELLPSSGPVRTAIMGDETRAKQEQASRVRHFMNYYITNVMEDYTPDMDQMLFYLPLAGSTFKKVYYDEVMGRAVSKFVPAEHLVVPYETSDLDTCSNIAHVIRMNLNDLRKQQLAGVYRDIPVIPQQGNADEVQGELDRITGFEPGSVDYDCTLLEFHANLDLEGFEDKDDEGEPTGIKVPYIVTISQDNGQVLSIRRNYRDGDSLKSKIQYFVHYKFLPGFGFYGLGLIHTIGGLSRTATAALRQLIDAGTLSNLPAGFKARGLRIRDDDDPLQPGEFRDVDAPGGAIRDSLMPLPFKGPDQTLFNLLGFVVQAGQRFATITDLKVGDGNQQAAVGTTLAMLEQGTRVMSAVHKRLHYAMRIEFKLLSRVMSEFLPQEYPYTVEGGDQAIMASDFNDRVDIIPVSNPNTFSQAQRIALAQTKMQLATSAPELHNMHEIFRDMYEAIGVSDVDRLMKKVPDEEPRPMDPASENINAMDMVQLTAFQGQNHQAHIMAHLVFASSPMIGGMPPVAMSIQKHVMEHVKLQAEEQAMMQLQQAGPMPAEQQDVQLQALIAQGVAQGMQQVKQMSAQVSGQGPDPLVKLKEQELQIKAQSEQADAQNDQARLQLEAQNQQLRAEQFDKRLASQEAQTAARIDSAMERELMKQRGQ